MTWRIWTAGVLGLALLAALAVRRVEVPRYLDIDAQMATATFHVHSHASHDCMTDAATLTAGARAAQADAVILTDHNVQDAGGPARGDVCLPSFAELSTQAGHLIALGLPQSPSRDLRRRHDVVQAVEHAGALPIVAHPTDTKRPWTGGWEHVGGLEVANVASAARRIGGFGMLGLIPLVATFAAAPQLALLQLMDRDAGALALWDAKPHQSLVGLCGLDAHGWIPTAQAMGMWQLGLFGLSGLQARRSCGPENGLVQAVRQGQFYCYNALLGPRPRVVFAVQHRQQGLIAASARMPQSDVQALVIAVPRLTVGVVKTVVWRNDRVLQRSDDPSMYLDAPLAGTYRIELWAALPTLLGTHRWAPIVYSNRITLLNA